MREPVASGRVRIAASQERVFDTLVDTARWGAWFTMHRSWPDEPPVLSAGVEYRHLFEVFGAVDTVSFRVDEFDAPRRLALYGAGNHRAAIRMTYDLRGAGVGAVVACSVDVESQVPGLGAVAGRGVKAVAGKTLSAEVDYVLRRLGAWVEGRPVADEAAPVVAGAGRLLGFARRVAPDIDYESMATELTSRDGLNKRDK